MSLLEHPDAQALLADATVTPEQVHGCQERITTFLQRYLPRFDRVEQRTHATLVIRGLLSGLQRKTCKPIAVEATGPVWKTIVEIANRHDAATIVMGSRGLTGLRPMLLGSVSSAIVHHADRPTLIIRQRTQQTGRSPR